VTGKPEESSPPEARVERPAETLIASPSPDPQDPLPESNWTWRRWSSIGVAVLGLILTAIVILSLRRIGQADTTAEVRLAVVEALASVAAWSLALVAFDRVLLMVAPSAEQVIRGFQVVAATVRGVTFRTETRTRATPGAAETTTTSTAEAPVDPAKAD
jgi:hypothetical protein